MKLKWTKTRTGYTLTDNGTPVAHLIWTDNDTLRGIWDDGTYLGNYARVAEAKREVAAAVRIATALYT